MIVGMILRTTPVRLVVRMILRMTPVRLVVGTIVTGGFVCQHHLDPRRADATPGRLGEVVSDS
jgi:hypothetical protein